MATSRRLYGAALANYNRARGRTSRALTRVVQSRPAVTVVQSRPIAAYRRKSGLSSVLTGRAIGSALGGAVGGALYRVTPDWGTALNVLLPLGAGIGASLIPGLRVLAPGLYSSAGFIAGYELAGKWITTPSQ